MIAVCFDESFMLVHDSFVPNISFVIPNHVNSGWHSYIFTTFFLKKRANGRDPWAQESVVVGGVAQEAGRSTGGPFSGARLLQKKKTEILSALTKGWGASALSKKIK